MNPTSLLPQSGTNFKLYYLVPLSFVYLFSQFGDQLYLLFALIALIGAASRHSEGEAIYGPGGEEKTQISHEEKIRRIGTLIYKDKKPFGYSASSTEEIIKEGEFDSKLWGVTVGILFLFQIALSILYLVAIYNLAVHRFEINFLGAVLLFSLSALPIYRVLKYIWPNASQMDEDIPEFDPEFKDVIDGFVYMLNSDGVTPTKIDYEPAEGGVFKINCEANHKYGEAVSEDINRVAVTFCSIVDRSTYPLDRAEITLVTTDDVEVEFQIDPIWCRKVLEGEFSSDHYIQRVHRTASVNANNGSVDDVFETV